jgi:hypothetical protein
MRSKRLLWKTFQSRKTYMLRHVSIKLLLLMSQFSHRNNKLTIPVIGLRIEELQITL